MTNYLRDNYSRAAYAQYMIWAVLGISLVMLFVTYRELHLFSDMALGILSERKLKSMMTISIVVGIFYSGIFLISGILFIQWFRRAYYNLHLRVHDLEYTEGWAAGGWFVPVMSFYVPVKIMSELYQRTEQYLVENHPDYIPWMKLRFITFWWILWVLSNLLATTEFFIARGADNMQDILLSTRIGMLHLLVNIPLCFLALKVVRDYASTEPFLSYPPAIPLVSPLALPLYDVEKPADID